MKNRLYPSRNRADGGTSVRHRRCFVSRETRERSDLLRFVYDGEQRLFWDAGEKLPGRGWWLALEKETLLRCTRTLIARKKKKKGQAEGGTAEDFLRSCALVLEQRCLSFLALARRAGLAVAGARRSVAMAQEGDLKALITTPLSSLEERRKILKANRRDAAPVCCTRFSAIALGRVFAREDTVYVGVGGKKANVAIGLVERLLQEIDRFERLLRIIECESTEGLKPFPASKTLSTIRRLSPTKEA